MAVQQAQCRSQACRDWVAAGRPWELAPSMRDLQLVVASYGFTVYAFPDDSHLTASTPEDHTSFSATGFPGPAPRWVGNAIDIMPRNDSLAAQREAEALALQIIIDKDAGVPGTEHIKYINWTTAEGQCYHTSWQPTKKTVASTDKGHTHISGRSDWARRTAPAYDPVARMNGDGMDLNTPSGWTKLFVGEGAYPPPWLGGTVGNQLQHIRETAHYAKLAALNAAASSAEGLALLKVIASKVDIDPAELAAVAESSRAGAAKGAEEALKTALAGQADSVANLVLARLAVAGVGSVATHDAMVAAVNEAFDEAFKAKTS